MRITGDFFMAISKLNTFLTKHHRIIFGVFAVLIILAFVLADWIGGGGSFFGGGPGNEVAGTVFGEKVTYHDLNDKLREFDLLGIRVPSEQAESFALQIAAIDELAKRNKITVSEEEVNKAIVDMFRNEKGEFEEAAYRKFIDKTLKERGYTEDDLIAAKRNQLIREKQIRIFTDSMIVTDEEVKNFYNMINHRVEAISTTVKTADYVKQAEAKVSEKALQEFFKANSQGYKIPAKLNAMVVKFAPESYEKEVTVTEAELKQAYDANKERLPKVKGKDGKETTPTFAQAKGNLVKELKKPKTMDIARQKADDFSREVYDKVKDQTDAAKVFATFAAEKQLKAEFTGMFSADAVKAGKFGSEWLVSGLAAIAASGDIWLSNVIADQDGFYVGFLTEYIPERQAEYKEVKDKVRADFIQSEAAKLAQKRAEAIIADLKKVSGKNRIARAKAATKEKFTALPVGTVWNPQQSPAYISSLVAMKTADISNALPVADGYAVILITDHKAPEKPYVANDEFTVFYKAYKAIKSQDFQNALVGFAGANIQVSPKPEQGQAK